MSLTFFTRCLKENKKIKNSDLAKLSWGNYSCIDKNNGLVYIKPSGVDLDAINENDISVVDLEGNQLSGMKCSVDTQIHLSLYKNFEEITSICHTHSTYATAFSQAGKDINMYGTTHADVFPSAIRVITPPSEIYQKKDHEKLLGEFISNSLKPFKNNGAIMVKYHGPFVWSANFSAVDIAIALEEISRMAYLTETLGCTKSLSCEISNLHWERKNGEGKWYGQNRD